MGKSGKGCMTMKYGVLLPGWDTMLQDGFRECFRVLKPHGTLIFKWCSYEIPLKNVLALTDVKPLFGHNSGKQMLTHWIAFLKPNAEFRNAASKASNSEGSVQ
jgi:SAM-dependent methyltransferase